MPETREQEPVKLEEVLTFPVGQPLGQMRIGSVKMGKGTPNRFLLAYAADLPIDPWAEALFFPQDTLKIALHAHDGTRLWVRDIGKGVVPGPMFCPIAAADLDGDGVDEIFFLNNADPEHPMSLKGRQIERLDINTGETTGQWPWPHSYANSESMSSSYRNFLMVGSVTGREVLLSVQGTYRALSFQAWQPDMTPRWRVDIAPDDPGARGCHKNPILDINGDGIDELLYGERCLSFDTGEELFCCDRDTWHGHSDVIAPFRDPHTGQYLIFTCREGHQAGQPRVVCFDDKGERVWSRIDEGHMDMGWVAHIGDNGHPIAMAVRIGQKRFTQQGIKRSDKECFTWDAVTGAEVEPGFDVFGTVPYDINGDGFDELIKGNEILDHKGSPMAAFQGTSPAAGTFLDLPGLHIAAWQPDGTVRFYADRNAADI